MANNKSVEEEMSLADDLIEKLNKGILEPNEILWEVARHLFGESAYLELRAISQMPEGQEKVDATVRFWKEHGQNRGSK